MGQGVSSEEATYAAWAAKEGRYEDLQHHLLPGGDIAIYRDTEGNTLMHYAAEGGYIRCVELLRANGVKLNSLNKQGYSPLHVAVTKSKCGAVSKLLELGCRVDPVSRFAITPLHLAAHHGKLGCVRVLLGHRACADAAESWGQTPLMLAVGRGHVEVVVALLRAGCDPWLAERKAGLTAVHIAACTDATALLALLDDGVNPNFPTKAGTTPLEVAIDNRRSDAVRVLLEYGAYCHPVKFKTESRLSRQPIVAMVTRQWGQPRSLKSMSRVAWRQTLGVGRVDLWAESHMRPDDPLKDYLLFRDIGPPLMLSKLATADCKLGAGVKSKKLLL